MFEELVVLVACLESQGCSQASSLYYNKHPEIKQMVKKHTEKVKDYVGPEMVMVLGPTLFMAAGGTGTIRVNKNYSLQVGPNKQMLTYRIEF